MLRAGRALAGEQMGPAWRLLRRGTGVPVPLGARPSPRASCLLSDTSHLINHPANTSHGLREDFTSAASGASPSGTGCGAAVFELDRAPREEPLRNTHAQQLGGMPWGSVRAPQEELLRSTRPLAQGPCPGAASGPLPPRLTAPPRGALRPLEKTGHVGNAEPRLSF